MEGPSEEFRRIVTAVVIRFYNQRGHAVPAAPVLERFAAHLCALIANRGLPRALRDDECGAPGGLPEQECAQLVARVMVGLDDALLKDTAKQLVKACFHPEFKVCRDSFREVTREGACRRQDIERVRSRVSGTHCVDCPHWVALTPDAHVAYLKQEWRGGGPEFAANRDVFLPEDFRALRLWLQAAARGSRPPV